MTDGVHTARGGAVPEVSLPALFWEWFKIALLVVGGGYAIIVVADEVFGRRRRWLKDGELLANLPVLSSVPGLIAGNSAIYVGLKTRGRLGAVVALAGVALPSVAIFFTGTLAFAALPKGNVWLDGAFLGLRSALSGVLAGTIWRTLFKTRADWAQSVGVELAPLPVKSRLAGALTLAVFVAAAAFTAWESLFAFLKFGCIAIGGGFPLIPFYFGTFVGADAALLKMPAEDFSNLIALTQMTPGPFSLNAATYFGYRLNGAIGSLVAAAALLAPSYFMLTAVLTGLDRWRGHALVRVLVAMLKPVSVVLMSIALWKFGSLSVWGVDGDGGCFVRPLPAVLALFAAVMLVKRKMSIMALIFACAAVGAASVLWN